MVNQPVVVLPSFQTFSADLVPETLHNLLVEMLVNNLAWINRRLLSSVLKVKRNHQHPPEV